MLEKFEMQSYKTLLSNDYDRIVKEITEYFQGVRIKWTQCTNKFKNFGSMKIHLEKFHKITTEK